MMKNLPEAGLGILRLLEAVLEPEACLDLDLSLNAEVLVWGITMGSLGDLLGTCEAALGGLLKNRNIKKVLIKIYIVCKLIDQTR